MQEVSTTRKQSNDILSSPSKENQQANKKKVLIEEIAFEDDVD